MVQEASLSMMEFSQVSVLCVFLSEMLILCFERKYIYVWVIVVLIQNEI